MLRTKQEYHEQVLWQRHNLRLHIRAPRLYPESWTMLLLKFQESTDGEAIMFFPHHYLHPQKQLPPAELRWQNSQSTQKL